MKCKELELIVEQEGLQPLPPDAREHLVGCPACRNLLADFSAIVDTAGELGADADVPQRLWTSLRAQLVSEGIIRDSGKGRWWNSIAVWVRHPVFATAAAGLVIALAAAWELYQPPAPPQPIPPTYAETAAMLANQEKGVGRLPRLPQASPVDVSLRDNLEIVNKFIADCELRVRQEPGDDVAREYLSGAYQQKADLLSTMMERSGGGD